MFTRVYKLCLIDLIGESANQKEIEEFIDLYVNDYVREKNENLDYEVMFSEDECEQIIEETVKRYKEL